MCTASEAQFVSAGEEYLRNTKSILLRANLQRHDFTQKPSGGRAIRGPGLPAL